MKNFCKFKQFKYRKLVSLSFALISYFILSSCQQPIKKVDFWKTKVLEAHDGVDVLTQISTLVFKGRIFTKGDNGTVVLILSRPGKLRATMRYIKNYEDRILLENQGWRDFGNGFEDSVGHSLDAMIFQYNHLNLPVALLDEKIKILYVEQKIDGQDFPILEIIAKKEPQMTIIIDPQTGLIRQVNGRIFMGDNEVIMGVGYNDYRKIDGVMLPHRIINYVNGKAIAETRFDTVLVNAELDQKSFYIDH